MIMVDEIDVAHAEAAFLLALRLKTRPQYRGQSAVCCRECGEALPEARRRALPGVQRCVACTASHEQAR
ncbi:TraR/DksA C4-type zinc finger protein [Providencia stuartii]|uniref:TraR/DksA C4-type zinc finger protein n=1 Tax=Providencia stuartii TaxID=588 RepID=UPI00111F9AE5|nr:TraR/DksA C4-type zinc finger protein [Providencia stuartii]